MILGLVISNNTSSNYRLWRHLRRFLWEVSRCKKAIGAAKQQSGHQKVLNFLAYEAQTNQHKIRIAFFECNKEVYATLQHCPVWCSGKEIEWALDLKAKGSALRKCRKNCLIHFFTLMLVRVHN